MFIRRLVLSNLRARRTRVALTVAAIALSVSLVVAVTSGYASVQSAVRKFMDQYMGAIDAQVTRQNDPRGGVTERVVAALRADPDVRRVDGRVEIETPVLNHEGKPLPGRSAQVFGVERSAPKGGDPRIDLMTLLAGEFFTTPDGEVAVVDQALAERLLAPPAAEAERDHEGPETQPAAAAADDEDKPKRDPKDVLGTTLTLPGERKTTLKVVGVIRKPEILAQQIQTIYVPLRTLQRFQGWDKSNPAGPQVNRVTIELNKGVDPRNWARRWESRLAGIDPNLKLKLNRDSRSELDKQMAMIDLLSYLGGTVSMLAATFIVFSSLSMGVTERQRTLAMLRAVGAYRSQVGWLVIIEGMMLAVAGVIVGVPLGVFWVKLLTLKFDDLFSAGVTISWGGVLFGSAGSVLAALAASALPAWWATRVSPLEAMNPEAGGTPARLPVRSAVAGALLIAIDPFLFFGPLERICALLGASDPKVSALWVRFILHFAIGLPGIMVGFFLFSPLFIKATEKVAGPLVARLLGLNPRLLRQQLSSGIWRAAGTAAVLMVGLAVLVVMQVEGNLRLRGWRLPVKFPDIFIVSPPGLVAKSGLEIERQSVLEGIPGIRGDEIMPIAIASPQFGTGLFAQLQVALNPDATMFFGIDPSKAFRMMELEFRDGNAADAQRMLAAGRMLTLADGRVIHGTIEGVPPPATGPSTASSTAPAAAAPPPVGMAEVAAVPGDTATIKDIRAAPQTIPKAQVAKVERGRYLIVTNEFKELKGLGVGGDFPLKRTDRTLANYKIVGVVWSPGIDVIVSVFDMGRQFDQRTAASVFGTIRDAREDFGIERVYLFAANLEWDVRRTDLLKSMKERLRLEGMRAGDVRQIKERIVKAFDRLLLLASSVAFAAMAVASLGVTNTVMAGIRTRRWQFGILRSIGVTRGQLLRLVLSEAALLGLIASALGLAAGTVMSVDAKRLSVMTTGYNPPVAVPWGILAVGVGVVLLISLAASLWPAVTAARAEPLKLLQAGRAAT